MSIDKFVKSHSYVMRNLIRHPETIAKKMIRSIDAEILYPDELSSLFLKKIGRAMKLCPVKRSLNKDIEIRTRFTTG